MDDRAVRSHCRRSADQPILQPLVIALLVAMSHVLPDRTTQGCLPNEDDLPQALFS